MSCTEDPIYLREISARPWRRAAGPSRILRIALCALARGRQRRRLVQLDDRLLDDIGVTRGAAVREARKPFWRL